MIIYGLDLKASNPRNYTYALLGIFENTALSDDPRTRRSIYSDYNKPTSGVFTNFTLWQIMHFGSLRASQCIHAIRGRNWQSLECTAPSKVMPHHYCSPERPTWALWHADRAKWVNEVLKLLWRHDVNAPTSTAGMVHLQSYKAIITCPGLPASNDRLKLTGFRTQVTKHSRGCACLPLLRSTEASERSQHGCSKRVLIIYRS